MAPIVKSIEDLLAELQAQGHTRPEDLTDPSTGAPRSLHDRMLIARARVPGYVRPPQAASPAATTANASERAEEAFFAVLAARDGDLAASRNELAGMRASLASANTALASLKAELATARGDLSESRRQLQEFNREETISALTKDLTTAKAAATRHETNVTRLEGLCRLRGLDPASAVPNVRMMEPSASFDEMERRYDAARTPQERQRIIKQLETEAAAEAAEAAKP